MAKYNGTQASHLYEKSMHTLCTISEQPLLVEASTYPRPKSITHLRTFSDNGVYVTLHIFLVIRRDYSGVRIVRIIAYIWLDTHPETSNGTNSSIIKQNIALEMAKCDIFDTSPLIARGCCSGAYTT